MSSPRAGNTIIWVAVVVVAIGAALIGYTSVYSNKDKGTAVLHAHQDGNSPHKHSNNALVPKNMPTEVQLTKHSATNPHAGNNHTNDAHTVGASQNNTTVDFSLLAAAEDDILIGDPQAPVRIVEYASLSCPHCATMHLEILPQIKQNYVDTGKAFIMFRHFPLNAPALRASMAVNCAAPAQQEGLLNQFFATQKEWAFDSNYLTNITKIAEAYGIDTTAAEACFTDVEQENKALQSRQLGAMLGVQSTPTLFVNETRLDGAVNVEAITATIEAILNPDADIAAEDGDNAQEKPEE